MFRAFVVWGACLVLAGCGGGESSGGATASGGSTPAVTPAVFDAGQQVSLRVPSMHCPVACWPKVKETLEKQGGVAEVTLAQQKKEDEIDNPVVTIKLNGKFDATQAVAALSSAGFDDAAVEQ